MNRRFSLLSLLVVCVFTQAAQADQVTPETVSEQIRQAESVYNEARSVDHGWVITHKLLEEAKAALEDDQVMNADELSKKALRTANASVTQSIKEKEVWHSRMPSL
jgi:hypothetical protein